LKGVVGYLCGAIESFRMVALLVKPTVGCLGVVEVVVAEGLTKRFNGVVAVDNVSFKVYEGEIFGFLGPNGAGKTTTVRMLTGILPPDSGRAFVLGFNVLEKPLDVKKRIGVVPEDSNVYLDLTVWDNMMFMAELYNVPKGVRESRVRELLELMNLLERKNVKAKKLSKGLRQRLLICMALIHRPTLLFLDEPTSGLDVQSAKQIRDMLRKLNRDEGVTVFLTTHNMWEAEELCDRIAIINNGRLASISTPEKLKEAYMKLHVIEVGFEGEVGSVDVFSKALKCKVEFFNGKYRVYTEDVDETIGDIVAYARTYRLKIRSLNVVEPSLEEVFLKIVGGG